MGYMEMPSATYAPVSVGPAASGSYGMPYGGGYNNNSILDIAALGLVFGDGIGRRGKDGCKDDCCEKMIEMHDHHDDHNHTVDEIGDVKDEVCAAERQMGDYAMMLQKCCCDTDKDVLETKYALANNILETKYDLGSLIQNGTFQTTLQFKDLTHDVDLQFCGVNRNIDSVKHNQEIIAKDAAMQLAECCCKLENKIRDGIDATNKTAAETQMLIIKTDAKNDLKEAERERRALERQIDCLIADKRDRDGRDNTNILNNFGTITDSLNKLVNSLGKTTAAAA